MAKHTFRLSVPAFLLGLILYPAGGLQALGLGEARVESWLGQPLDVTVGLLDVDRDEAESVRVVPASLADFERLGIPSEVLGLGLEVEVDRRATPPQVRVRSRHSANDPIVRLLLDARWSSGRVLREYTLFLDPPTTPSAPPVADTRAESSRPDAARPVTDPVPTRQAESRPARAQEAAGSARDDANGRLAGISDDFVTVASGDTLWSIAYDWRPSSSMSMDQVMLAIFNLNPDAFIDGNINNLRSSAELEMPGVDDIESIGRASARRQVSEHMSRWQPAAVSEVPVVSEAALPDTPDTVSAPEPEPAPEEAGASAAESDAAQAAGEDYRLDVVPPDEDGFSEGTAVAEDELDRVADSLAELQEEAAAEGLDGEAFDDHASEIRTALDQRDMAGLAVAEESLAELQARLREMREARALEEEAVEPEAAGSDDLVADYMRELEDEFDISSGDQPAQADADEPADEEEAVDQPAVAQPMTVTKTSTASSSGSGGLPGWLWPIAGLVLILVVVVVLLRRRRQDAPGPLDAIDRALPPVADGSEGLGRHLARLNRLADEGRDDEFVDAFDQMYQQVDDESAPEWQEALLLAQVHAPDHPLLTPPETLEPDFDEPAPDTDSAGTEPVQPGAGPDSQEADVLFDEVFGEDRAAGDGLVEDEPDEVDIGVLSGRVDESGRDVRDVAPADRAPEPGSQDRDEFLTTDASPGLVEHEAAQPEPVEPQPADQDGDDEGGLDLDFDWAEPAPEETPSQPDPDEGPDEQGVVDDLHLADLEVEAGEDSAEMPQDADDGEVDEWLEQWEAEDAPSLQDLAEDLELADQASGDDEQGERLDVDEGDLPEDGLELDFSDLEMSTGLPDETEAAEDGGAEFGEPLETPDDEPSRAALSDEDCDIKLDLARAYISSGLMDSAVEVLEEVARDGGPEKAAEARRLLEENR